MVSIQDVEQLLRLGHETRPFEVKGPGKKTETAYVARVARAAMAMGNLRDGGLVCLGIADDQLAAMGPGLDDGAFQQWSDHDDVSDALSRYSEPPVSFHPHPTELSNGARVVVLEIAEFEDVPHVCKKDYPGVLQKGQVYVRPRGKPQSIAVPSADEMRQLLDVAIDKGVRFFVRRATLAGVALTSSATSAGDIDPAAVEREAAEVWPEPWREILNGRGGGPAAYFDVAITPRPFRSDRIRRAQLRDFVVEHTVRLRGWPVPMVDLETPMRAYPTWVGQDRPERVSPHAEAWRVFTSGQFLHRRVLTTDLRDLSEFELTVPSATGGVAVWDVLFYLVEVAELAARWATSLDCEAVDVSVALVGIGGRELISGDHNRELHGPYTVDVEQVHTSRTLDVARLVAEPRAIGVELAQDIFGQFGTDLPDQVLFDWQQQILRHLRG